MCSLEINPYELIKIVLTSFLTASCYFTVWIYIFNHPLIHGHLDSFKYFAVIIYIIMLKWITVFMCFFILLKIYQGKFLEIGLSGQKITAYVSMLDIAKLSPNNYTSLHFPSSTWECMLSHGMANRICCHTF